MFISILLDTDNSQVRNRRIAEPTYSYNYKMTSSTSWYVDGQGSLKGFFQTSYCVLRKCIGSLCDPEASQSKITTKFSWVSSLSPPGGPEDQWFMLSSLESPQLEPLSQQDVWCWHSELSGFPPLSTDFHTAHRWECLWLFMVVSQWLVLKVCFACFLLCVGPSSPNTPHESWQSKALPWQHWIIWQRLLFYEIHHLRVFTKLSSVPVDYMDPVSAGRKLNCGFDQIVHLSPLCVLLNLQVVLREDTPRQSRGDAKQTEARRGLPHQRERECTRGLLPLCEVSGSAWVHRPGGVAWFTLALFFYNLTLRSVNSFHNWSGSQVSILGRSESLTQPLPYSSEVSVLPSGDQCLSVMVLGMSFVSSFSADADRAHFLLFVWLQSDLPSRLISSQQVTCKVGAKIWILITVWTVLAPLRQLVLNVTLLLAWLIHLTNSYQTIIDTPVW